LHACAIILVALQPTWSFSQTLDSSSPAERRRAEDASVDRNIFLSSAETIGEGKIAFNSYELLLAGLTYGVTDNLQLSVSTLLPITKDFPLVLVFNGKYRLIHTDRFILSVIPSGSIAHESTTDVTVGTMGAGVALDYLLDQQGNFVFHGGATIAWGFGGSDSDDMDFADGALFLLNAGMNFRIHKYIKLLFELTLPGGYYKDDFEILEEGLLVGYGVRFCSSFISVDLTFIRPIHPDVETDFVMGIPFVAFSARF
jgi:hypothetical protein